MHDFVPADVDAGKSLGHRFTHAAQSCVVFLPPERVVRVPLAARTGTGLRMDSAPLGTLCLCRAHTTDQWAIRERLRAECGLIARPNPLPLAGMGSALMRDVVMSTDDFGMRDLRVGGARGLCNPVLFCRGAMGLG